MVWYFLLRCLKLFPNHIVSSFVKISLKFTILVEYSSKTMFQTSFNIPSSWNSYLQFSHSFCLSFSNFVGFHFSVDCIALVFYFSFWIWQGYWIFLPFALHLDSITFTYFNYLLFSITLFYPPAFFFGMAFQYASMSIVFCPWWHL